MSTQPHWLDKVAELLQADTADLSALARIAGGDPKVFYRGANLNGVDLSGQDLRGMEFTALYCDNVRVDQHTKLDSRYQKDFERLLARSLPEGVERRVALVIGNADHKLGVPLANAVDDAAAVAATLKRLGFDPVIQGTNFGLIEMGRALADFAVCADEANMAVIYFVGHGIEADGENYLLPVDAELEHVRRLPYEAIKLREVIHIVDSVRELGLIILDVNRGNPFGIQMRGGDAVLPLDRAFTDVEPWGKTLVVHTNRADTAPHDDPKGGCSPYAQALANWLETPDLDVRLMLGRVRDAVIEVTGGKQQPHTYGSLGGAEIYLKRSPSLLNLIPRGEFRRLIQQLDRQSELIREEHGRIPIWKQNLRRRLKEVEVQLNVAKDSIKNVEQMSLISPGINELISTIKDGIIAIEEGMHSLNDKRFSDALRQGAQGLLGVTTHTVRMTKRRFATLGLPWEKDVADENFEAVESAFGLSELPSRDTSESSIILVRNGAEDREVRRVPGAGVPFQDCWEYRGQPISGPEMVVIPAGSFMMGSPESEPGRVREESPQHAVSFTKPFAVSRYAVTRGEFAAFVNAAWHYMGSGAFIWRAKEWEREPNKSWRDAGFAQDDRHPVVCVSWKDAQAYVKWLTRRTGKGYRLLAEAEWEYVCRAGTVSPFWWGSSITPAQANYDGHYTYEGGGTNGEYRQRTLPVDSFDANPWGLYQVHGNVWEWCEDVWHETYQGAPGDGSAWAKGRYRILRGGSWYRMPWMLRAAGRARLDDNMRINDLGFRIARTL